MHRVVVLGRGGAGKSTLARRGPERADFWWWVLTYRWRWRPRVLAAIAEHAPGATVHVLRTPRRTEAWLGGLGA